MDGYFERARNFIYKNARPLDLARWKYHFENGSSDEVMEALQFYQNEDGGFGNALEPDSWDHNSSPTQTWAATEILREIGHSDKSHPLVQGLLEYLSSGKDFENGFWCFTSRTPGEYPHAPWWHFDEKETCIGSYNPTVSLAGFIIDNAESKSGIYSGALEIIERAAENFIKEDITEMHALRCFVQMLEYVEDKGVIDVQTLKAFKSKLYRLANETMVTDISQWNSYVCRPSFFIGTTKSAFYLGREEAIKAECEYILENQREDGSWDVTWDWNSYPDFWPIARNWWKSQIIIGNLILLKNFEAIH